MGWSKIPFLIVCVATILPWVAAYMDEKWVTYIPILLGLSAYFVYLIQNSSKAMRLNRGFLVSFIIIFVSMSWQLVYGLGAGSGGLVMIFVLTFIFFKFFEFQNDGIQTQQLIRQISIIYAIHVVFILFELTFRLLGFTDLLVSIAGNATEVTKYKMYNKAVFLKYIGFRDMTGLNGLLLGSQSASQLSLFSVIWFAPFYGHNPLYTFNKRSYLWFLLSVATFLVSITMTSSILMALFLLLFIYIIPLSNLKILRHKIVFLLAVIMFNALLIQMIFFNIGEYSHFLTYWEAFVASIIAYMALSPLQQFFGFGRRAVDLVSSSDFGIGMLLLQVGALLVGLSIVSLITIFMSANRHVARLKKNSFHRIPWTWLATVNSLLALGWGASLIHYTPAVELGGRELFAFHLAVCLLAIRNMRRHEVSVKTSCSPTHET